MPFRARLLDDGAGGTDGAALAAGAELADGTPLVDEADGAVGLLAAVERMTAADTALALGGDGGVAEGLRSVKRRTTSASATSASVETTLAAMAMSFHGGAGDDGT